MSEYKDLIKNMVWSYSRLGAYKSCPYSFYLQYIEKEKESESNFYAEVGSFVHGILEKIFRGEMSVDDATEYFMKNWKKKITHKLSKKEAVNKAYEACANYLAETDFDSIDDYEILGIEQKIKTEISGYSFVGYIDLLLKEKSTGELIVVDHKSAKYPLKADGKTPLKNTEETFESYKRQIYLYSKYVYEKYGQWPSKLAWNHFKEQRIVVIPFLQSEYQAALDWFVEEIHKIENDNLFDANKDYFFCANLCNFRKSCEYRDRPQPWKTKKLNDKR